MKQHCRPYPLAITIAILLGLSACGDGSGDSVATTPSTVTTTFSGTAATGAAMANATVTISCASGTGTTNTAPNGSYSKDLSDVTLPCVLRAASADGATVLYSVTTAATSGAQVANITPLTHLVLASLTGTDPATFFASFNATTASAVTASSVSAAQTAVLTTLANAGVDTVGLTDLIGGALVGGSGSGYDGVLDAVQDLLVSSGTSLTTLTTAAAAASPSVATSTPITGVASLPANFLLKPAASNCNALRSGDYVAINPRSGSTLTDQIGTVSFNASTLTWTNASVSDGGGTMVANGECRYTIDTDEYVVSQAGVLMGSNTEAGVKGLSIIFPKQTIAVSELAGTWNMAGIEAGGTSPLNNGTITIDGSGLATTITDCDGAAPDGVCETVTSTASNGIRISSNSAGGFDMASTLVDDTWTDRLFAYRAGSGNLMLLSISGNGSLSVLTKQRTQGLPTVGEVFVGGWDLTINNQLQAGSLTAFAAGTTVTAVDTSTGSVTRMQKTVTGVNDYSDTVVQNSPRVGFNYRAAGTTTSVFDGRTVTIRARANLNMRGMGVSFQLVPHINSLRMSVDMAAN